LLLIDGNNVMGSRPDGWWRDRAAAGGRLVGRVRAWAEAQDRPATIVFDQPVRLPADGDGGAVTVVLARRRGRDAADDRIVELLDDAGEPVEVVTSDRGLAERVRARGGRVTSAGAFLRTLDAVDPDLS
jgi:predicted RNA-binding protein with PIN domain